MAKGIKSWFFTETEEPADQKKGTKGPLVKKIKEVEAAPTSTESIPEVKDGRQGEVSQKFVDILFKVLREKDLDGFDYMEFKKSLQSLKKMDMDIDTRIKSAFAMAQTMGVSKDRLLETANFYIGVLKSEEQKFEQALEHQQQKQVDGKKTKIEQLKSQIEKKEAHLKKLQAEVAQHNKQINTLHQEIDQATTKIANTKNDFIASFNSLVNQIKLDMKHINDYLK
jgi:chromosome segregation ATPase